MNKKDLIRLIILYILLFLLGTTFFLISFHIPIFAKIVDIFFFRGIALIILSGLIISMIMIFLNEKVN